MNMRLFAMMGALATMACVATTGCIVVAGGGSGGSGGSGGDTGGVGGAGGSGGGQGGSAGMGGAGGAGGSCTESCAEASTDPSLPFCMTTAGKDAETLYNAFYDCTCMGLCKEVCAKDMTSYCTTGTPDAACTACLTAIDGTGCGNEQTQCANN